MLLQFELTKEQTEQFEKWKNENEPDLYAGLIGGRYTYELTPTSVGDTLVVKDNLKNIEINLTDYENW